MVEGVLEEFVAPTTWEAFEGEDEVVGEGVAGAEVSEVVVDGAAVELAGGLDPFGGEGREG